MTCMIYDSMFAITYFSSFFHNPLRVREIIIGKKCESVSKQCGKQQSLDFFEGVIQDFLNGRRKESKARCYRIHNSFVMCSQWRHKSVCISPCNISIKWGVLWVKLLISTDECIFLDLPDLSVRVPGAEIILQVLGIALHASVNDVHDLLDLLVPSCHFTDALKDHEQTYNSGFIIVNSSALPVFQNIYCKN